MGLYPLPAWIQSFFFTAPSENGFKMETFTQTLDHPFAQEAFTKWFIGCYQSSGNPQHCQWLWLSQANSLHAELTPPMFRGKRGGLPAGQEKKARLRGLWGIRWHVDFRSSLSQFYCLKELCRVQKTDGMLVKFLSQHCWWGNTLLLLESRTIAQGAQDKPCGICSSVSSTSPHFWPLNVFYLWWLKHSAYWYGQPLLICRYQQAKTLIAWTWSPPLVNATSSSCCYRHFYKLGLK